MWRKTYPHHTLWVILNTWRTEHSNNTGENRIAYLSHVLPLRSALEKTQYLSPFANLLSRMCIAQRSPEGYPMPSCPLRPTFCITHAHFLLWSKACIRRAHRSWSSPLLSHTLSCFLSTSHWLTSNCAYCFYFQPCSDYLSYKASFLSLGIWTLGAKWFYVILCIVGC